MAKAKKTAALTVGERLEQALVPEGEQPYPVPGNWDWVNLPFVCKYIRAGGDKPACFSEEKTDITTIPVVANGISNEGIVGYTDIANENENTITISGRGTIGFSVLRKYPYYPIIRLIVICPKENINSLFIKYIFDHFLENGTGSSIPQLTVPMLKNKAIPIPPFAEQQRIVDRIESLFAKLDEAKEKALAALDSFETRKAALLHKAFTGELTAKWRQENGVVDWEETTLNNVVKDFKYGTSEKSEYGNLGMPVLRIPNIDCNRLNFSDLKYLPHNNIDTDDQAQKNDILIIRSNGSRDLVGQCALVPELGEKFAYASFLIRIRASQSIVPKFLVLYLNSSEARTQMFAKAKSSAGINNINTKELGAITLRLPSIQEQAEIICRIDNFFAKEQKAKELCSVIDNIDLIKKSILARAFRGELGTNNPTEESAVELLKSIL